MLSKNILRHGKLVSKLKTSQKRFLSDSEKPIAVVLNDQRTTEAKGAMKDFMQKTSTGTKEGGLWSRLRQDIAPPPVVETVRPVQNNPRDTARNSNPYVRPSYNDDGEEVTQQQNGGYERRVGFNNAPKVSGQSRYNPPSSSSKKAAPRGVGGLGSAGGGGGGGGFGAARREQRLLEEEEAYLRGENREGDDDDSDEIKDMSSLDPEDLDLIFDAKKETEEIVSGRKDCTAGAGDALDTWLANVYMESMKAEDGMCIEMDSGINVKKLKVAKPRSMSQMVYSMKPNIRGAEMGSAGYALGEEAWKIVNKNMYYTENEKYQLVDLVAKYQNDVKSYVATHNEIRKVEDEPYPPCAYDGIFQYGFKRGEDYIEDEAYTKSIRVVVKENNPYDQAPTDWSVQAVEDEDQL